MRLASERAKGRCKEQLKGQKANAVDSSKGKRPDADLPKEVHGDASVANTRHLVRRHETLPVAAQPITRIGLVVLHGPQLV